MDSVAVSLAGLATVSLLAWGTRRSRKRGVPYASLCGGRVLVRARLQGTPEPLPPSHFERAWRMLSVAWLRRQARLYMHGYWPAGDPPCMVNLARRPQAREVIRSPFELGFHSGPDLRPTLALQARVALLGLAGAITALVVGSPDPSAGAPPIPAQPRQGEGLRGVPSAVGLEAGGGGSLFVASIASPAVHPFRRGATAAVTSTGPTVPGTSGQFTLQHANYAAWHTNAIPATHSNTIGRHANASNHINLDLRPLPQFPQ